MPLLHESYCSLFLSFLVYIAQLFARVKVTRWLSAVLSSPALKSKWHVGSTQRWQGLCVDVGRGGWLLPRVLKIFWTQCSHVEVCSVPYKEQRRTFYFAIYEANSYLCSRVCHSRVLPLHPELSLIKIHVSTWDVWFFCVIDNMNYLLPQPTIFVFIYI